MRKILILLILLICLPISASANLGTTTNKLSNIIDKMMNGNAIKIVCIGDSITYGVSSQGQSLNSYPISLQAKLRTIYANNNITVINDGVSGQKSDEGVANYDTVVVPQNPDLVILMYGINDISGYVPPTNTIDKYKDDIATLIEKNNSHNYATIVMTPAFTTMPNQSNKFIENYGNGAIEVAQSYGVPYVDIQKRFQDIYLNGSALPNKLMIDSAHLTDQGYEYLADIVLHDALDKTSVSIDKREEKKIPIINSKFVKYDNAGISGTTRQEAFNNYLWKKDGTLGTKLTFDFYENISGMDLHLITPKTANGGKLIVTDNGVQLPESINFYSEENSIYDALALVYEDIPIGFHHLEFNISNLSTGDATQVIDNPSMFMSQLVFKPTENRKSDIVTASDNLSFPSVESFTPILGNGDMNYKSTTTMNTDILTSGKHVQLKTNKTLVFEAEGRFFTNSGVSWFGNIASNSLGYNNGYTVVMDTYNITLYQSGINNTPSTFINSTSPIQIDFSKAHKLRVEHSYSGVIKVFFDDTLYITANNKRFNSGYFGFYSYQGNGNKISLTRFGYTYN